MILKAILTILLVFSFSIIPVFDNYQTSTVYAQEEENNEDGEEESEAVETEEVESLPFLFHVLVNNEPKELLEGKKVLVTHNDAVRLSGLAESNASLKIYFGEKEIETIADENGFWFALFSITNMEENQYVVRIGEGEIENTKEIVTLVVGDGEYLVDPLETQGGISEMILKEVQSYLITIILIPFAILFGWFLRSVAFKRKSKGSKDTTGTKKKKRK